MSRYSAESVPAQSPPKRELSPMPAPKTALVPFEVSPFPYRGEVPEKNRMFLDVLEGDRRGHYSARGGTYWEDQTYSDQRVLLHIPKGFDPRRPALMIVFFHGNEATLTRDVRNRQAVPRQVAESGLNAVLVAPQFAVNALDSSAGRFWEPGVFTEFLNEAAERLTELYGDERARGAFHGAPVVIAAYSGGYNPAAFILHSGRRRRPRARARAARRAVRRDRQIRGLARATATGLLRQRLRQGGAPGERGAATHADRARRALSDQAAGEPGARAAWRSSPPTTRSSTWIS